MKITQDHTTYIIENGEITVKVKTTHDGSGKVAIYPYQDKKKNKLSFCFLNSKPEKIQAICEVLLKAAEIGEKTKEEKCVSPDVPTKKSAD